MFVLARIRDRRAKEQAIHAKIVTRIEEGLGRLQAAIASGRLKKEADTHRRLGRLLQRNSRAAQAFTVTIKTLPEPVGKARLSISWEKDADWHRRADLSESCYLLRTNVKQYLQLSEAEWAFRIELRLRPIWHQKEDRILGHILVCFLASGEIPVALDAPLWPGDAPRPLLEELAKMRPIA